MKTSRNDVAFPVTFVVLFFTPTEPPLDALFALGRDDQGHSKHRDEQAAEYEMFHGPPVNSN